tara:strand:+ start:517 stop:660 length:144 start_codon:yes stop_codon:yes gene_type:complete
MNKTKQFKIQTPVGSVESDSGNHIVDVITVLVAILLVFVGKKIMEKI